MPFYRGENRFFVYKKTKKAKQRKKQKQKNKKKIRRV